LIGWIVVGGSWAELEGEVGEVRHLGWVGIGVEEVEDVGVVCWETVAEGEGVHGGEEAVGGGRVVEI